jgi:hypothetical protein
MRRMISRDCCCVVVWREGLLGRIHLCYTELFLEFRDCLVFLGSMVQMRSFQFFIPF